MESDRRGVSEVVSFVLVFSLIIASVGAVYVVGYSGLQDARNHEQVNNAQRAFSVLAENVEDIRRHGSPGRATEIKLGGAQLFTGDPIEIEVTGDYEAGTNSSEDFTTGNISIAPIIYQSESDEEIRYVNGAIIRGSGPNSSIMVREPAALTHPSRTLIPILQMEPKAGTSGGVGGATTAHVRTRRTLTTLISGKATGTYDTVTITIRSPYADLWHDYFERQGVTCYQNTGETTCTMQDVERLYVVLVKMTVTIE